MNRPIIYLLVATGVAILGGVFFFSGSSRQGSPSPDITDFEKTRDQQKAPDFSLRDYTGNTVALSDFAGRPLVINSWAAWCPFCVNELVDFVEAQKEFGDQVVIIAIDRAESLKTAKKFSDKIGVSDELVFLLDPDDSFYRSIGGFAMPETIFVDTQGNIIHHKRGPMKIEEIRQKIQNIL